MWKPWENESETQRIRRQKERYRDDKRWQIIDERKNDPMGRLHTRHRKKLMICGACVFLAMLLLIGHWYANREAVTTANTSEVDMAAQAMLRQYKGWWF